MDNVLIHAVQWHIDHPSVIIMDNRTGDCWTLCDLDAPPTQTIATLVETPICCEWIQFWEPMLYGVMLTANALSSGAHTAHVDIHKEDKNR
jgi:hypothetical protein